MMIRYNVKPPGGEGFISSLIRFWWILINNYHTYRWLAAQLLMSPSRYNRLRIEKMSGETAVITGGSRGIGAAVVRKLLQCDMHVIIGCRDRTATNNLVKSIRRQGITTGTAEALSLDLTSLNSIREFCYKIIKKDIVIRTLINNAGVKDIPYGITVEGLEHHFQVNYLGHVLLTYMLLPKLDCSADRSKSSRIINVSSVAHYGAYPDLNDIQMKRFYSSEKAYMDSKLMQIAFSNFLDKQLEKAGSFVHSYAVHPGFVKTEMWQQINWVSKIGFFHHLIFQKAEQVADCIVHSALSPRLEGLPGRNLFYSQESLKPHPLSTDEKFQRRLWELSCEYLQINKDFLSSEEECEEEAQKINKTDCCNRQFNKFENCDNCNNSPLQNDSKVSKDSWWKWQSTTTTTEFKQNSHSRQQIIYVKPYYEFFIDNLFISLNLNKSWLRHLQAFSIFLLQRLDKFNSQFNLINIFNKYE